MPIIISIVFRFRCSSGRWSRTLRWRVGPRAPLRRCPPFPPYNTLPARETPGRAAAGRSGRGSRRRLQRRERRGGHTVYLRAPRLLSYFSPLLARRLTLPFTWGASVSPRCKQKKEPVGNQADRRGHEETTAPLSIICSHVTNVSSVASFVAVRRPPLLQITVLVDDIECVASSVLNHQHIVCGMVVIVAWSCCLSPTITTYITAHGGVLHHGDQ